MDTRLHRDIDLLFVFLAYPARLMDAAQKRAELVDYCEMAGGRAAAYES